MSDYRTEKPCCFCQRNEDELCDKGSEVCKYYKAYKQGETEMIRLTIEDEKGETVTCLTEEREEL